MTRAFRRAAAPLWLAAVLAAGACAPTPPPVVAPGAPRYPDYVFPAVGREFADADMLARHDRAWQALQAGDDRTAERDFTDLLRRAPGFYPAETGLGYVDVAREAYDAALDRFDAALARAPGYAPALAGRGEALLGADRPEDALAAFEAALAADPTLAGVSRRVEVLRFRTLEAVVAQARRATDEGRLDDAAGIYQRAIAMSPDSPFLHRELADVDRARGRLDAALAEARRAAELDPGDARSLVALAEVQAARGAYDEALSALGKAAEIDPGPAIEQRLRQVQGQTTLARLPAEYRGIPRAPAVTRGALAALIGIRLEPLVKQAPQREGVFITDTRDHWASSWILEVARAGVMEVYPNYTFQPAATVDRGELAAVASRLLAIIARRRPALAEAWRNPSYKFTDLVPGHLSYPAAALAVTAGVMPVLENRTFQLTRVVTGAEAVAAIDRLQQLAGIPAQ